MTHNFKKLSGSIIDLKVELSKEEFNEYFNRAYEDALVQVELKGFRKGTAPRELAEKVIDKNAVWEKAANEAVRRSLSELTQENEWVVIDQPKINILPAKDGLKYSGQLVLFPEIKLADYKQIAQKEMVATKKRIEAIKVSDDEIKKSLDWLRESRAKTKTVNRAAKKDDVIDINFTVSTDSRPLTGNENQRDQFILGKGRFFPEFENNLVGAQVGKDYEFSLTVPADYWKEDLRGKKLDFKVKVNNVLERELPLVNDEFAQGLGKFKSLAELEENIKSGLQQEQEFKEKEKAQIKIIEEIAGKSKIDTPQIMIDKVLENMKKESNADNGVVASSAKQSQEKVARQRVESQLVIYKIAEEENIKPTEEELEKERARVDNEKFRDYIYDVLQSKKVFEFLLKQ